MRIPIMSVCKERRDRPCFEYSNGTLRMKNDCSSHAVTLPLQFTWVCNCAHVLFKRERDALLGNSKVKLHKSSQSLPSTEHKGKRMRHLLFGQATAWMLVPPLLPLHKCIIYAAITLFPSKKTFVSLARRDSYRPSLHAAVSIEKWALHSLYGAHIFLILSSLTL